MSTNQPRTIDNLGAGVSEKYAIDQKLYDSSLIKDAKIVADHAEIIANQPNIPFLDTILELNTINPPWADFSAPAGFQTHKRPIYTHQAIPSFGSIEKQIEKLSSLPEDEKTATLINMLDQLHKIDTDLAYANSKRAQYHKG
jgi:hypothetical protein